MKIFIYALTYMDSRDYEASLHVEGLFLDSAAAIWEWAEKVNTVGYRRSWYDWDIDVYLADTIVTTAEESTLLSEEYEHVRKACRFNGLLPHLQKRYNVGLD